ncbi:hypothetical protein N658DRAFT_493556 [Parathielavia hyrcaniae]|uniref:Uncharacterized protein n=1 Tax=Parathielavia hyrcaniae TaxID=113614 RepID=A0AAN6QB94_9PEZI|nr:hypothetical protein N658DRAFT_493556 [Parathielavia hyrcaniae]
MNTEQGQKDPGRARVRFSHPEASATPPAPDRFSAAPCPYRTALRKANTDIPNAPAEDDTYLRALRQLSATHRPSLDNLLPDRLTTTDPASPPLPPDKTTQEPSPSPAPSPRIAPATTTDMQVAPIAGQRYHALPNGNAYVEPVYGSSSSPAHHLLHHLLHHHRMHGTLDHNTAANKVWPAAEGVASFRHAASDDKNNDTTTTDHARRTSSASSSSRYAALKHMPPTTTTTFQYAEEYATTSGSCGAGPGDEAREDRWRYVEFVRSLVFSCPYNHDERCLGSQGGRSRFALKKELPSHARQARKWLADVIWPYRGGGYWEWVMAAREASRL